MKLEGENEADALCEERKNGREHGIKIKEREMIAINRERGKE